MAGALAAVLLLSLAVVRADLGRAKGKVGARDLFRAGRAVTWLSTARVFLFASRDIWFVVSLPLFLSSGLGWDFEAVGAFMALWVIGYGVVQAAAPRLLRATTTQGQGARAARTWAGALLAVTAGLALAVTLEPAHLDLVLVAGLLVFGLVFAMNSAVHSWLIVSLSDGDRVALNVGFYYSANAWGRFLGTLLSGLAHQAWGLSGSLWGSALLVALALAASLPLTLGGGTNTDEGS
jgi:predicted MFS family arabinose efflux permease